MVHEDEYELEDRIEALFVNVYGWDNVSRQHTFSSTGRRVDLLVNVGAKHLAVELESSGDNLIDGLGQTLLYAAHADYITPLLVVADDHTIEEPELQMISDAVEVVSESELRDRLAAFDH